MLGRAGGLTVLQSKGDRYSVLQGDKLRFGTVETVISYHTRHHQVTFTPTLQWAHSEQYRIYCQVNIAVAYIPQ